MTDERLNELEAIANAATPGNYTLGFTDTPDERLIVAACNSLLPLITALREARDEVERLTAERDAALATTRRIETLIPHNQYQGDLSLDANVSVLIQHITAERDAAFQRGVAAMREAAVMAVPGHYVGQIIAHLPEPDDK